MAEFSPKFKEALSLVQKPGRYTGGEPGCIYKDKSKVDVRMAFCFPDTYEIGMSFLGEKILYDILNRHENWWCERAFMPWLDMKAEMERLSLVRSSCRASSTVRRKTGRGVRSCVTCARAGPSSRMPIW